MERRSESAVKAWGLLLALILRQFIRRHKRASRLDRK